MRALVVLFVVLLVGIVVLGFLRGWFQLSTDTSNQRPNATISMDKEKIHADEQQAKDKLRGLGQDAKEKIGDRAGKRNEPARQP